MPSKAEEFETGNGSAESEICWLTDWWEVLMHAGSFLWRVLRAPKHTRAE